MSSMPKAGDRAPDFDLPTDSGGTLSLKSVAGRTLVVYFYPKDDTSGCTREAIDFNGLRNAFTKAGVMVVGISADSAASHTKFKKKHDLGLTLLSDGKAIARAYGVWAEKSMYGRAYMGIERTTFLIDAAGKIVRVWTKVKVLGHAEEVLRAAQAA